MDACRGAAAGVVLEDPQVEGSGGGDPLAAAFVPAPSPTPGELLASHEPVAVQPSEQEDLCPVDAFEGLDASADAAVDVAFEDQQMDASDGGDTLAAFDPALDDASTFRLGEPLARPEPAAVQSSEPEALCPFDAFEDRAVDEALFDPPDAEDLAALSAPEKAVSHVSAPSIAAAERPLARAYRKPEIQPRDNAYLAAARAAALEHARRNSDAVLSRGKLTQRIGLGVALPLLFGAVWALVALPEGVQLSPSAAAAAPRPISDEQNAGERKGAYEAAMQQIATGRADAGIASLRRLAEGGHAPAQYQLSKLYENGAGVSRSLPLARQWAERAASAGNCLAMHDVGVYFAQGEGVPPDEAAAFRWFREAADFGIADSQHNLAILYEQGRGVAANPAEALFWYLVAARHGDTSAADHAVVLATQVSQASVEQARARARAFRARTPDAEANGAE